MAAGSYRRVFVPADRPEEWPTAGQRYLPVDRSEFERLTEAARDRRALAKTGGIHVTDARHELSISEDFSLQGVSRFDVFLIDEPSNVLSLPRSNAVLRAAYWEEPGGDRRKATIGNWGKNGGDLSSFGVLVERSGGLVIEWSMPRPTHVASLEYGLRFPPALKQRLTIDVPANSSAEVSSGRVVETASSPNAGAKRWTFQLAPGEEHRLQVNHLPTTPAEPNSMPRVAVNEAYGVSPDGLTYDGVFRLQAIAAEASELRFAVPASLKVTEVSVNQASATWKADDENAELIFVTLPHTDSPLEVSLRATGNLVLNEPWKLPSVSPSGAFWTEGTASVWVDPGLELQSLNPTGARLINAVGIERKEGGEAYRLQAWSSDASTEIQVAERKSALHAERGLTIEYASSELIGRCHVRLWTVGKPVLQVEARLKPGWNVESVEAESADALAEWHVAGHGNDRHLYLQLRRAASEQEPIALKISARMPLRGRAPAAKVSELDWIAFPEAQPFNRKFVIVDRRGGEFTLSNPRPGVLLPLSSLSPAERELFATTTAGRIVAPELASPDDLVRVETARPRIQGEAWIELAHTPAGFRHQAAIDCRPVGGAVSELVVAASRPLPPEARWDIRETGEQPSVQSISSGEDSPSVPGYRYRVRLASPRSEAFRLHLSWRGGAGDSASINNLSLPDATVWQSWAILRGNPSEVMVDAGGRLPAVAIPDVQDDGPPILACLRLVDEPTDSSASLPGMRLVSNPNQDSVPAVACRSLSITSLEFADGSETHQLTYDLQTHLDETIEIEPPRGFEVVAARLDGDELIVSSAATQNSKIRAPLAGRRVATLELDLHGRRAPLDARTKIVPVLPAVSFPLQRGRWTVASPAPYKLDGWRFDSASWKHRIFGPLLRQRKPTSSQHEATAFASHAAPEVASIPAGWSQATQYFVTAPTPARILRVDSFRAARHLSWLASAVLAAVMWPLRRAWIVAIWPAMAIACLILPADWIFLPQAVLLGSISGVVVRVLITAFSLPRRNVPTHPSRTVAQLGLLAAALLFGVDSAAMADEAPPPAVLFPIDGEGKTAGRDVYVSADLLSELLPSMERSRPGRADYVLLDAEYEIDLVDDAASGDVVPGECRLHFQIRTFRDDVVVTLPLNKNDGDWSLSESTLGGKDIRLDWDSSGSFLPVEISKAGFHQLVVKLRPLVTTPAGENKVAIAVPPLSGAGVEITHPASIEGLAVNSMRLSPPPEATKTTARLSAQRTLEVAWPMRPRHAPAGVVVDQLSSLRVDPASARLDVQLRVTGDAAEFRSLELRVPANLKLLPPADGSPIVGAEIRPGMQNLIELKLRPDAAEPMTLALQFQLQRSVSWGRLQFPIVRVLGAASGAQHIAVTVDPRLQLRESATTNLTSIEIDELERQWGQLEPPPTVQFALQPEADPSWTMQIEPAPLRFSPRESLELLCGPGQAAITYVADMGDVRGEHLVHQVLAPAELEVNDISLITGEQMEDVPVRWSRLSSGKLSIFLSQPMSQPHRLRIEGKIGYDQGPSVRIPRMALVGFGGSPIDVSIFRTSEVLIRTSGLDDASSGAGTGDNSTGLLIGRYQVDRSASSMPRIEVAVNEARYSADALLALDLQGKTSAARLALHGQILEGIVDRLRLSVTSDLSALRLADVDGGAEVEISAAEDGQQILEVNLKQPLSAGEEFLVRLSGDVSLTDVQRIRLPQLWFLNAARQGIYVALPKASGNQSAEWTRRGLQKDTLPKALADEIDKSNTLDTYRAVRRRFVAEQRIFPNALRTPAVRLATTRVLLDAEGRWSSITDFTVQPGGSLELSVKLPEGAELLQASADGEPILATNVIDGELPIPLSSRFLPRMISIAYQSAPDGPPGRFELDIPMVMIDGRPIKVNQDFWQVEGFRSAEFASEAGDATLDASAWAEAIRKEQVDVLLDAAPIAFQLPEWELKNWCKPWLRRLQSEDIVSLTASQEKSWSQLRERMIKLVGDDPGAEMVDSPPVDPEFAIYYHGSRSGKLALTRVHSDYGIGRWLLASLIGVATVMAWRHAARVEPALSLLKRRPALIGVAAGALWWAYFTPALLGPAIITLSLAAGLKMRREQVALQRGPTPWRRTSDSIPATN